MRTIGLCDGKYTIVYDEEKAAIHEILRHGAPWPAANPPTSKLELCLVYKIVELQDRLEETRKRIWPQHRVLRCPSCDKIHLDVGIFATRLHHMHKCDVTPTGADGCGHEWDVEYYSLGIPEEQP